MEDSLIAGKTLTEWKKAYPLLNKIISMEEVFWKNPKYQVYKEAVITARLNEENVRDAEERLSRFAPYIAKVFPETQETNGMIESPIVEIHNFHNQLEKMFNQNIQGKILLKCDNQLAISGSIKARGGIYEVLKHAEDLAIENNMLTMNDDYSIINNDEFRKFYSKYSISVGSTGNLGLSIGIMSAKIGFNVTVHMSADAKQWKKDLLRSKGVIVIEHNSDYSKAVEEGRKQSDANPNSFFVDDENSTDLFLGYAVAASRLKKQLDELNVKVDEDHPLFVYLPCGVGGGPGGVTFGLKLIFKDHVHCFFSEPTHSPCMLIGLMTEQHDRVSVQDFGIDNLTDADGLAVGRPSGFVGKSLENVISGVYTIEDKMLYALLSTLIDTEDIYLEPSALAGVLGPVQLFKSRSGRKYLEQNKLFHKMANATHIPWATGGNMVPKEIMESYYNKGLQISSEMGDMLSKLKKSKKF
ncbi:D-serine ammonia-lyase [Peribacillus cavernae]|uniref:Probable D-serine dehydratase n=1 Tax=Peribacillus cavernae TaxID=1674310 RepID=A0A3S0V7Z0_9BACI|nr:D-serine ammonia-lyase [Peribacillus cavernae]MDQ0221045.1 D-serine dehydratase [Peribacillus cavernae]RUQ25821.1 D-serine ammonia-lyase [Peribacillus cavernae]